MLKDVSWLARLLTPDQLPLGCAKYFPIRCIQEASGGRRSGGRKDEKRIALLDLTTGGEIAFRNGTNITEKGRDSTAQSITMYVCQSITPIV